MPSTRTSDLSKPKRASTASSTPAKRARKGQHKGQHGSGNEVRKEPDAAESERQRDGAPNGSKETHINASPAGEALVSGKTTGPRHQTGTIKRGHIYFFYRPKVERGEAHSLDDVQKLHMLLVPRPPEFSTYQGADKTDNEKTEDSETRLLERGADAIPASQPRDTPQKHYRLITIGKKHLPDPKHSGGVGKRKEIFWATVTKIGDDLHTLEQGLGERTYDTKTRSTRHLGPARLAARGAYAIVNNVPRVPSDRKSHFGYSLSHPAPEDLGDVHQSLGLSSAAAFVLQVKNPAAPVTGDQTFGGLSANRKAQYPEKILRDVFGKGSRGREPYGLRFASCERADLLDYEGAELLFIAARSGEGLETSLGEGRGEALQNIEEKESKMAVEDVLRELAMDKNLFPVEPLTGEWI